MQRFCIVFITLIFSNVFGFVEIPRPYKLILLLVLLYLGIRKNPSHEFNKAFTIYFVGLVLSIFSCFIFRAQNIINSIVAYVNFWDLGLFYFFSSEFFDRKTLKWSLNFLGISVIIVYLIQFLVLQLFGLSFRELSESSLENTMDVRFRIPCSGLIYLIYFLRLRSFIEKRKRFDLLIVVLTVLCAIIMNFRSMLTLMFILTLYDMWKLHVSVKKIIQSSIALCIVGYLLSTTTLIQSKFDQLIERQETDNFENEDYVRTTAFNYYFNEHSKNTVERMLGSGYPDGHSKYNDYMSGLSEMGIHYDDLGLIGTSYILGILTIVGVLFYAIKAFRNEYSQEYGLWFLFLVISSVLTYEIFRDGNMIIQSLVLAYITKFRVLPNSIMSNEKK